MNTFQDAPIQDPLGNPLPSTWVLWFRKVVRQLLDPLINSLTIGSSPNYTTFGTNGFITGYGTAMGYADIYFPQSVPKATGAGNPTIVTWNGNIKGYSYSVNDTNTFDPQEYDHAGVSGGTGTWHIHFVSRTNVAADRGIKWEIEYSQVSPGSAFPGTTTPAAVEYTVPANTAVNTHVFLNLGTFTTLGPGSIMTVRLKRVAASGTAPADDPVVLGLHYHYQINNPTGSQNISSK